MSNLVAHLREALGKRASRRLRKQSWLPACIQLQSQKRSLPIFVRHDAILYAQEQAGFLQSPLEICIEESQEIHRVTFQEIQRHPFKNLLLHIDFLEAKA